MVDRNIIESLGLSQEQIEDQVNELFNQEHQVLLDQTIEKKTQALVPGKILAGKIVDKIGSDVIVELGLKSGGIVPSDEFDDPTEIVIGNDIEVLLEEVDAEGGTILLSKRKADRIRGWEKIIESNNEGDVVKGMVTRRIKGGLLVDIGVPVFLPASQVDIRKPGDISRFIGQEIECQILKMDTENRNIVVSRRKIIEEERSSSKEKVLNEIEPGQLRKGIVKNIAAFGVFVDLGGVDGLLHISDMSWGRVSHPSEVVKLDEEVECVVIGVDKATEKISLGLKQKADSPWDTVEQRYPVGSKTNGTVVNITNYGAFIRLEEGVEGLVHISEMSWTKRIAHPADILNLNDEIEVVILEVNIEKQEISLGIKQLTADPWAVASQKYPPGTIVTAKASGLTNYGAFVEIEPGIDGLVHISDLSWTKKYNHPGELLKRGQEIKCLVLEIDEEKHRVSLGIKQLTEDPWIKAIPQKYLPGQVVKGVVTKMTNFGVFVELEDELEGLLHISEIADHKIEKPQDILEMGQEVEVKILRVDNDSRKIGLSLRRVQWAAEHAEQVETVELEQQQAEIEKSTSSASRRGGLDGALLPGADTVEDAITTSAEETSESKDAVAEPPEETSESKDAIVETAEETGESKDAIAEPAEDTSESKDAIAEPAEDTSESKDAVAEPAEDTSESKDAVAEPTEDTSESKDAIAEAAKDTSEKEDVEKSD